MSRLVDMRHEPRVVGLALACTVVYVRCWYAAEQGSDDYHVAVLAGIALGLVVGRTWILLSSVAPLGLALVSSDQNASLVGIVIYLSFAAATIAAGLGVRIVGRSLVPAEGSPGRTVFRVLGVIGSLAVAFLVSFYVLLVVELAENVTEAELKTRVVVGLIPVWLALTTFVVTAGKLMMGTTSRASSRTVALAAGSAGLIVAITGALLVAEVPPGPY